jgi:hypothetical protein
VGVLLLGFRVSDERYGSAVLRVHTNSTCRHVAGFERAGEREREERERRERDLGTVSWTMRVHGGKRDGFSPC